MSTKTIGVVIGLGMAKVGIKLECNEFYPNCIPTGDVPNILRLGVEIRATTKFHLINNIIL